MMLAAIAFTCALQAPLAQRSSVSRRSAPANMKVGPPPTASQFNVPRALSSHLFCNSHLRWLVLPAVDDDRSHRHSWPRRRPGEQFLPFSAQTAPRARA